MVTNNHIIETEKIANCVVRKFGEYNGVAFEMFSVLPSIFANGIDLEGIAYDVDFLKVETSDYGLVCWFIDKEEDAFPIPLHRLLEVNPILYSAIITNLYDFLYGE